MPGSVVLDAAIGLVFVFLTASLICSAAVEWVANKLNKRGEYLLRGLRELLDIPPATLSGHGSGTTVDAVVGGGLSNKRQSRDELQRLAELGATMREDLKALVPIGETISLPAPLADLILAHPLISGLHRPGRPGRAKDMFMPVNVRAKKMHLASYVSARAFARALLDLLVPNGAGVATVGELRASLSKLPTALPAREALLTLLRDTGDSVNGFRRGLEQWYDEHMGRVSGWYKRWTQWRLLIAGAVLALVMNVDAIAIGQSLYEDEPVRTAVVAQSVSATVCTARSAAKQADCVEKQADVLRSLDVPVGWDLTAADKECREQNDGRACGFGWLPFAWHEAFEGGVGRALLTLVGWLFTAVAVSFGAPFWFDSLSKLGSLRTAGRRPGENAPYEPTPKDGAEAP